MKIKILYDNEPEKGLKNGWGFSCYIEAKQNIQTRLRLDLLE